MLRERGAAAARAVRLAQAFHEACELDLQALKPGNVGVHGGGHGMEVSDFHASAAAAAAPLAAPEATVGGRILEAVRATRAVVPCNTNLGILLLGAPLLHGAQNARPGETLREATARTLAALSVADARCAYKAIRLARPGGLGESRRHDVWDEPTVTLLAAMTEARRRDAIAAQYANGFADVFDIGLPLMRSRRARFDSEAWAATAAYLEFASRLPDSHVRRKHGEEAAQEVATRAASLAARLDACADPDELTQDLLEWDRELKGAGINPGTSADLTVATALAGRIEEVMQTEFTAPGPLPARAERGCGAKPTMCQPSN